MSVRWFAALMMAVPATVVSIGLALPAPATLAVMPRTSWHPRDVGIDFEYAKHAKPYEKPQKTTKTIYAEEDAKQAGVGALFAEDPEMKEKIEYTGLRLKDENGFKYLTVHYTTVPAKPNDSIQTKMQELQKMVQRGYQVTDSVFSYMADIPYHYFISTNRIIAEDGIIAEGRQLKYSAQTNTPHSEYGRLLPQHLTVVVERQFKRDNRGKIVKDSDGNERYVPLTEKQKRALAALVTKLAVENQIPSDNIAWHSHYYAGTNCPTPEVIEEVKKIKKTLKARGI